MIYPLLRWVAAIALHWFYRDIRIVGHERIPLKGPLLIAVNHQNALVDSLVIAWVVPRQVAMTAKATLTDNPVIAWIFKCLHVIPLRRSRDEMAKPGEGKPDRARNARAFREMTDVLGKDGAILIFPEGKSHNEQGLEPLKTGLARLALQNRDEAELTGLKILPIGLVFQDKGRPGTLIDAWIGDAIEIDAWVGSDHLALTSEIATRLRSVCEHEGVLTSSSIIGQRRNGSFRETLISLAASWGRATHWLPIRLARNIAVQRSTDADQPAMLTILLGISFVAFTYAIQIAIVGFLLRSVFLAAFYLGILLCSAHYAAFRQYGRA